MSSGSELEVQDMLVIPCAGGCDNSVVVSATDRENFSVMNINFFCKECETLTKYKPDSKKPERLKRWVKGQTSLSTFEADDGKNNKE